MIFNIDADQAMNEIAEALESAGAQMSEEKFNQIATAIETAMPGIIQVLAQGVAEDWKSQAAGAGGWGSKYARAIKYHVQGTNAEIYIDEGIVDKGSNKPNFMFAMMIEEGVSSWSIKDALLASDKAHTGKDGVKYITVPFPVATPRSKGQGKMKTQFGGREMTAAMYSLVKNGGKLTSGKTGSGADVSGLSQYNTRQLHSQYGIFRRVSEKSTGWQYPNKSPRPVFPEVLKEVNNKIQEAISAFCKAVVQEYSK
jgi:hypothetical protein